MMQICIIDMKINPIKSGLYRTTVIKTGVYQQDLLNGE